MMRLLLCACLFAASSLHARSPLLDPVPVPFSKKPGESEDAAMTVVIYNQNFPQSEELARFRAWFAEFDAVQWDRQFERDVTAGRLDDLAKEVISDLRQGRCTDL